MSNNIGKSLQDLKNNYTIDQVYLFFEKCKKEEMAVNKMNAIILSQSMILSSPSYSRSSAASKRRAWKRFIDSFDWNKIQSAKKKPSMDMLKAMFGGMGVKPKKVEKKDVKK